MTYVYILESESTAGQRYIGVREDLKQRVTDHNRGHSPHTAKFVPWRLRFYAAFANKDVAHAFERYLKSGSGREFAFFYRRTQRKRRTLLPTASLRCASDRLRMNL